MSNYILACCLVSVASILIAKLLGQRQEILNLRATLLSEKLLIEELSKEKITHLEKIQRLSTRLEMMQNNSNQMELAQQAAMQSAERALRSLGADLAKQLLTAHQHENKNSQIQYDQTVTRTSQEIKAEIQKLLNSISVLEKEVEKSSSSVESIKSSILFPNHANNLTEITLSNILNSCGLKSDLDFKLQYTITKAGKQYRPDAVVFLPNSHFIVIDAKASKFFLEAENEASSESLLKSMHRHLKELSEKEYEGALLEHLEIDANEPYRLSTLMFLNTESMVEKISALDQNFLRSAWLKNIFPVGPTGLMNILSIARHYTLEVKQAANYKAILSETRQLLGALETVTSHGQKLGSSLQALVSNYDKFSASFNFSLLRRARNLSNLGMQNKGQRCNNLLKRYELVSNTVDSLGLEQDLESSEKNERKCTH